MEGLYHIRPYFLGIFPYIGHIGLFSMVGTSNLHRFLASMAMEITTGIHQIKNHKPNQNYQTLITIPVDPFGNFNGHCIAIKIIQLK